MKKHLHWTDVGLIGIFSIVSTLAIWSEFDPRGVLIFAALLGLGEITLHWRWRLGISCPHCGFDLLLYKRNPEQASQRVRQFFERRSVMPDFLLTGHALIETQRRLGSAKRKISAQKPDRKRSSNEKSRRHSDLQRI